MDLSNFGFFWQQTLDNPLLMLAVAMAMGVILVNGWTDDPNGHCDLCGCPLYERQSGVSSWAFLL